MIRSQGCKKAKLWCYLSPEVLSQFWWKLVYWFCQPYTHFYLIWSILKGENGMYAVLSKSLKQALAFRHLQTDFFFLCGTMIETIEPCILIPVWMILTFIQCHSFTGNKKFVHLFSHKFLSVHDLLVCLSFRNIYFHTIFSDLVIGTVVATLPWAWHSRVSAGTGWPGVNILWLGEVESLIRSFCHSVAARAVVWVDQSLKYTSMLQGH